jgi:hypothetical protein
MISINSHHSIDEKLNEIIKMQAEWKQSPPFVLSREIDNQLGNKFQGMKQELTTVTCGTIICLILTTDDGRKV